jgi:hypothetical protein
MANTPIDKEGTRDLLVRKELPRGKQYFHGNREIVSGPFFGLVCSCIREANDHKRGQTIVYAHLHQRSV